jgi:antitoxin (DNA-binding transcriptional repressor) of toxin-antitoxin stability system
MQDRTPGTTTFSLRGPVPLTLLGRCAPAVVRAVEAARRPALISRHGVVVAELAPCSWPDVADQARGGQFDLAELEDRSITIRELSRNTSAVLAEVVAGGVRFVKRRASVVARLAPLAPDLAPARPRRHDPAARDTLSPATGAAAAADH